MNDRNTIPSSPRGHSRGTRFAPVPGSEPYEGVGRALAKAFPAAGQGNIPQDMLHLLEKIGMPSGTK